jgi:hypothetical protein
MTVFFDVRTNRHNMKIWDVLLPLERLGVSCSQMTADAATRAVKTIPDKIGSRCPEADSSLSLSGLLFSRNQYRYKRHKESHTCLTLTLRALLMGIIWPSC